MRIAYLDCASGISGDMLLAALVDAGAPLEAIQADLDSLGLPQLTLRVEEVKKKGFRALKLHVDFPPEHKHRHLHHIEQMIDQSRLTAPRKALAKAIFRRLGEAEARVHGVAVEKVHFHEVGAADSIADIVGAAIALDLLEVDRVVCSPIPTGTGFVEIAHGRVSVPAPATAELLAGVPIAPSEVRCELTTPTGAAIATTLAESFGPLPAMRIERIGYGAGTKDLDEQPNLLRLVLGAADEVRPGEQVCVIETNLDDLSGELVGHCAQLLLEAGALDVTATPIQMKKGRPGVTLTVICTPPEAGRMEQILFRETTTLGVRRHAAQRTTLLRRPHRVATPWGEVEGKVAWSEETPERFSPEYESCRAAALAHRVPLAEVYEAARMAFAAERRT